MVFNRWKWLNWSYPNSNKILLIYFIDYPPHELFTFTYFIDCWAKIVFVSTQIIQLSCNVHRTMQQMTFSVAHLHSHWGYAILCGWHLISGNVLLCCWLDHCTDYFGSTTKSLAQQMFTRKCSQIPTYRYLSTQIHTQARLQKHSLKMQHRPDSQASDENCSGSNHDRNRTKRMMTTPT